MFRGLYAPHDARFLSAGEASGVGSRLTIHKKHCSFVSTFLIPVRIEKNQEKECQLLN
jgi:hypothetical protein